MRSGQDLACGSARDLGAGKGQQDTAEGDNAQRDPDVSMGMDEIVFEWALDTGSVINLGRYRWYGVLDRGMGIRAEHAGMD